MTLNEVINNMKGALHIDENVPFPTKKVIKSIKKIRKRYLKQRSSTNV